MDAAITRLVIYDSVLFGYNGDVGRWARRLENRFTWNARQEAPVNKRSVKSHWYPAHRYRGALQQGISGDAQRVGVKRWQTTISSDAPYTLYVVRGTTGPITATRGEFMRVPANPGFGHRQKIRRVSGQRENNFFARAAEQTARRHPSIRGFSHNIG